MVTFRHAWFFCKRGVSKRVFWDGQKHGFVDIDQTATAIWVLHFGSEKPGFGQFLTVEIRACRFEGDLNLCYLCYFRQCSIGTCLVLLQCHWEVSKSVKKWCFRVFSVFSVVSGVEVCVGESLRLRGGKHVNWHPNTENTENTKNTRNSDISDKLTDVLTCQKGVIFVFSGVLPLRVEPADLLWFSDEINGLFDKTSETPIVTPIMTPTWPPDHRKRSLFQERVRHSS